MKSGEHVTVCVNVDDPSRLADVPANHCDGVGLTRTEFLFHDRPNLPTEDEQVAVYRQILDWSKGRPVTIRTLDAGGDKPVAGLTEDDETNPFLGLRGLRLSLERPEVFAVQLRALARTSAFGPLHVMFPMVTIADEFDRAKAMMVAAIQDCQKAGHAVGRPEIGMMVEAPAAAIAIDRFDADFFSIGSNDLIQYVTASSRDSQYVTDLYDPLNPAVLSLIGRVADHGRAVGKAVSVCGDMAADEETLTALLDCGVQSISVADVALARAKAVIAGYEARQ
jgi:phosphotransferase system enzyme I (PtsI)